MMPAPRRSPHSISHLGPRHGTRRSRGRTHVSTRPRATPLLKISLAPQGLTVTHIFLLWAKDLISLADPAALGGRARERTCSMKPVIGPRPSSGRPTLGMQDAPTVS